MMSLPEACPAIDQWPEFLRTLRTLARRRLLLKLYVLGLRSQCPRLPPASHYGRQLNRSRPAHLAPI